MSKYNVVDKVNHITSLWSNGGEGHFSNQDDLYKNLFNDVKDRIECFDSVLEIGAGDGSFAKWLLANFPICSYTILDTPKGVSLLRKEIDDKRVKFVKSSDYMDMPQAFDLVVSCNCLSETPKYYRECLFNNVILNSDHCFLVDGDQGIPNYRNSLKRGFEFSGYLVDFRENVYLCADFFFWRKHAL